VIALIVLGAIPVHPKEPSAGPADSAHAVYGTTTYGGAYDKGVVYKVDQAGNETVLYSFKGVPDGANPLLGRLTSDSAGNLYATTYFGGKHNRGTVVKLDPSGNETVLHNFGGISGENPMAGVIRDAGGNLYGTAVLGGLGCGVVFKINPIDNETTLHSFTGGSDGCNPQAGLIRDSLGNLYGTTLWGGPHNAGVVYKVDPAGNETVLYAFTGGADGRHPFGPVTQDSTGNLYGTAGDGGKYDLGVVYQVDPSGNETVLYSFRGGADDGAGPTAGVVRDSSGNLYGTTTFGGQKETGVVYKVDMGGNETVLHAFTGGKDGSVPLGALVRDAAGNLYGTTQYGGANGMGVVFKIGLAGQGHVLHAFTGTDGYYPAAGVIVR
jgi:uncharacterized repeat protein (TIGR03803 family)